MDQFDRSEHVRPQATAVARPEDHDSSTHEGSRRWLMATGAVAFVLLIAGALAFLVQTPEPPLAAAPPLGVELQRQSAEQELQLFMQDLEANSLRLGDNSDATVTQQILRDQIAFPTGPANLGGRVGPAPTEDPWFLGTGLLWLVPLFLILVVWPFIPLVRRERPGVSHS